MLCGTEPHPAHFRAKKYRIQEHFLSKEDFTHIMKNLPEKVPSTLPSIKFTDTLTWIV